MEEEAKEWFCYMVRCRDGTLYTGVATDPRERVKKHNWAVGAKFTAARRPVELIWSEKFPDYRLARKREAEIKSWARVKKLRLVEQ